MTSAWRRAGRSTWRTVREGVVRTLGFFMKEVTAVLRQPLLIGSLVLGPFVILMVFGLGYRGPHPEFRTILVVPNDPTIANYVDVYQQGFGDVFKLQQVTHDLDAALAALRADKADVVVDVPNDAYDRIINGKQAPLTLYYAETDPTSNGWVQYFAYVQTSEFNRRILLEVLRQSKGPASQALDYVAETRAQLDQIEADLESGDTPTATDRVSSVLAATRAIRGGQARALDRLSGTPDEPGAEASGQASQPLQAIEDELSSLQTEMADGRVSREAARQRLRDVRARLDRFESLVQRINQIPPETLVSPLVAVTDNIAPVEPSAVGFYTPAVLALLLQHIGVTLSSLSAVRDRVLGSIELFRVSPVGARHVILGKSLGFGALLLLVGAALTWATVGYLGVPSLGSPLSYWISIGLLVFDSIALGFAVATIAGNESQAVQLSMLVLLVSVFLGGFFLPLDLLFPWVRTASYLLPAAYGATNLRDIMLRGADPSPAFLFGPLALGLVLYALATLGLWRQMRRA